MIGVLLILLTAAVTAFALWPFFARRQSLVSVSRTDTPLGRLQLRKDILVGNITDLDFEYAMGKIGEADYQGLRDSLKRQASLVLEQIEVLDRPLAAPSAREHGRATHFCAHCGGKLPSGARFCPTCGNAVVA